MPREIHKKISGDSTEEIQGVILDRIPGWIFDGNQRFVYEIRKKSWEIKVEEISEEIPENIEELFLKDSRKVFLKEILEEVPEELRKWIRERIDGGILVKMPKVKKTGENK